LEIVRGCYLWIVKNITYDQKIKKHKNVSYNFDPHAVFKSKEAICTGYVTLFQYMLAQFDITSYSVGGYVQSENNPINIEVPDHAWAAIHIDDDWYLIDPTWDAGLSRDHKGRWVRLSDTYFCMPPDSFIIDHLPAVPMWQMKDTITTVSKFIDSDEIDSVYVTQDFWSTINYYSKLDGMPRKIFEDSAAYYFHPTKANANSYGHRLLDYAGILADSLSIVNKSAENGNAHELMLRILTLCNQADELTHFHNWQNELYAGTLLNYITHIYNHRNSETYINENIWDDMQSHLETAQKILVRMGQSYYKDVSLQQCIELQSLIESNSVSEE
jgi:hypothetical protein